MTEDGGIEGGLAPADHQGPWFVRQAGRQTGPFDLERVRTMARRGAVTRMHSLSRDGRTWEPAARVHEVFNPDGSVASGSSAPSAGAERDDGPATDAELSMAPDRADRPAPHATSPAAPSVRDPASSRAGAPAHSPPLPTPGHSAASPPGEPAVTSLVPVRPVLVAALAIATVAFACPTSRGADGALAWWWSEGVLGIAIRGVSLAALAAFWSIAFLRPEPVRATLACATAAMLAAVACVPLWDFASWAIPAALLVPACAILVSVATAGRPASATAATIAGTLSVGAVLVAGVLVILHPHAWAFVGVGLVLLGGAGTMTAAVRTVRAGSPDVTVLAGCIVGACGGLGAVFASGLVALQGEEPMGAARAAAGAAMTLCFATAAWAFAHESVQTAHLVMTDDEPDAASHAGP